MLVHYPLIWSALVMAPDPSRDDAQDVTVVVRVTCNTLEAICADAFVVTASLAARPA